tara:strand:- start:1779 stop:4397 length:2619 start_codon:yes stop_codon:yes gene_type:complete
MATRPQDSSGAYQPDVQGKLLPSEGPPDLGIFDGEVWHAGWKQAGASEDWGLNQTRYMNEAAQRMHDELTKRGYKVASPLITAGGVIARNWRGAPSPRPFSMKPGDFADRQDALYRALAAEQARDPKFLPEYRGIDGGEALFQYAIRKRQEALGEAADTLGRTGGTTQTVVGLATGLGHGLTDPTNYLPFPGAGQIAGGVARQVITAGVKEAGVNMGVALAMEPLVRGDAAALGRDRTTGDTIQDIALQGGVGALIGGGLTGVHVIANNRVQAARLEARKAAADRLFVGMPDEVKQAWIDAGTASSRSAVLDLSRAKPWDNWTPDEKAAAHVIDRESDIIETSPFIPKRANDEAHLDNLAGAAGRVEARERPARSAATVDGLGGAIGQYMQAVRGAESSGNDLAQAGTSSAFGRYQFTAPTWKSYYIKRFGRGGLTDAQIAARRADGTLQDILMRDMTGDHANRLAKAGQPVTAETLYMLHFAGPDAGVRLVAADPATRVADVLSAKAVEANAFLRDMTVGELRARFARKVGSDGAPMAPRAGDAGEANALRAEADAIRAENDRLMESAPIIEGPNGADMPVGSAREDGEAIVPVEAEPVGVDALLPQVGAADPVRATVPQSAAADDGLGPASILTFQPKDGAPGISVVREGDDLATAVFRDESGAVQAAVQVPISPAARDIYEPVSAYVRPEYRRQGIATKLYDALAAEGHPVDRVSGTGDLTPDGAAFVNGRRARQASDGATMAQAANEVAPFDAQDPIWRAIDDEEIGALEAALAKAADEAGLSDGAIGATHARAFYDPVGPAARAQADSMSHDLEAAIESGEIAGTPFATGGVAMADGQVAALYEMARGVIDALNDNDAAIAALKGCL